MTPSATPSPKRILIAEDEKPLAHALELKLQHEGYETMAVGDGQACLKQLAEGHFDVLLLDLMMPILDGFGVLEELQHAAHRPVIFTLSSLGQHEDEKRVQKLGVTKYFSKATVQLETIVEAVKNA
ncbi:MAG TPA: response regulator [Candidatus Saccharimonadia bacterium]